ncbi:MAG: serine/threonine-protein kinase [Myxococcota bacterium]
MDSPVPGSPSLSLVGRIFDERYEIRRYLTKGGMGAVYAGADLQTDRPVAVKILQEQSQDPLFRRRFFNEAAMCASLTHPNVVQILHYGVTDDRICFIVMELLEGETLNDLLRRDRRMSPTAALHVVRQVCSALEAAHAKGFVHRDLKPANIFVVSPDEGEGPGVKVLDFGLAKRVQVDTSITQTGVFLGSPSYMSPEQISGHEVGPGTDIYNLGLILYRMVTGVNPFQKDSVSATLLAQATHPPPTFAKVAPDLPAMAQVEWVALQCLEKRPESRFRSAVDLARAAEAALGVLSGEITGLDMRLEDGTLVLRRPTLPSMVRDVFPAAPPSKVTLFGAGLVLFGTFLVLMGVLLLGATLFFAS